LVAIQQAGIVTSAATEGEVENRGGALSDAVGRCSLPGSANGKMTHVVRHALASYFMMNGGSILVLQCVLGHQSLTVTMRYTHLAPDHLVEACTLNPLANLVVS
jgi:integrase